MQVAHFIFAVVLTIAVIVYMVIKNYGGRQRSTIIGAIKQIIISRMFDYLIIFHYNYYNELYKNTKYNTK